MTEKETEEKKQPLNRKEFIDMLDNMVLGYDNIPSYAMHAPVTHADMLSVLLIFQAIIKSES